MTESHKSAPVDVKMAARNGLTGAPETSNPVKGMSETGKPSGMPIGVMMTAGGGDLMVVVK